MASLIPRYIPYGVFQGQLHRGYRICTKATDFLSYALEVATILRDNGCANNKLKRGFKSFVATFVKKYPGHLKAVLSTIGEHVISITVPG
jgi:hypothetical protein